MNPQAYRLPTHAWPRQYDLDLHTRHDAEEFGGQVAIQLDIVESRDYLELHVRNLQVSEAVCHAGGCMRPGTLALDPAREVLTVRFAEPLPSGAATLTLTFAGHLNPALQGLYRAQDGPETMLATQCEETDARSIFPCLDEPVFKARFAVRVTTTPGVTVLANGPLREVTDSADGQARVWTFAPTKPMSTYLFALAIGDVAGTPEEVVDGTPIRVWAVRGKEPLGTFAHAYTKRLLPWYEAYFGAPYHFDKYDQVAVPGFASGAMENAGLVVFRQHLLLMDARTAAWDQEKGIALVVAHEFAHMWFGDLVTMRWWDDIWLNEAFAEWIAYKVVDILSPEYRVWDDFQAGKSTALSIDALTSTHAIYTPVATPTEVAEIFDAIAYEKGCAVLRMLEHFMGAAPFQAGLQTYMREFAESNAAGADLWRHLQQASDAPITRIMESWIMQPGYPYVRVEREDAGSTPRLRLRQQRFYSTPQAPESTATWQVPLVVRYADDAGTHETRYLLAEPEVVLPLAVQGALRWVYANADEIGFYRQDLAGPLLDQAIAALPQLTPVEQMGLLNDQWALTHQGSQCLTRFLDVLAALARSDNYHVLAQVVGYLHTLEQMLEEANDPAALARFRAWVAATFGERLAALGFVPQPGEPQARAQQRISVIDAMATLAEDPATRAEVAQWADREAADPAAVDGNLAPLFLAAAAQAGDAARFDHYLATYQARKAAGAAPQETLRYLYSFPAFRDPALVARTLDLLHTGTLPQESIGPLLRLMLGERHTQRATWAYIQAAWPTLRPRLTPWWAGKLVELTGRLPAALREEIVAFYTAHFAGEAEKSYARALEALDQWAAFQARTRPDLLAWFQNHELSTDYETD